MWHTKKRWWPHVKLAVEQMQVTAIFMIDTVRTVEAVTWLRSGADQKKFTNRAGARHRNIENQ